MGKRKWSEAIREQEQRLATERAAADRGVLAKWLYEEGPQQLLAQARTTFGKIRATMDPSIRWWTAGVVGVVGIAAVGVTLWPKAPEAGLPKDLVRKCVVAISEVPTEFAAKRMYAECLQMAREGKLL